MIYKWNASFYTLFKSLHLSGQVTLSEKKSVGNLGSKLVFNMIPSDSFLSPEVLLTEEVLVKKAGKWSNAYEMY